MLPEDGEIEVYKEVDISSRKVLRLCRYFLLGVVYVSHEGIIRKHLADQFPTVLLNCISVAGPQG